MDRVDYSIFREVKIAFREDIYSAIFIFSHRIIKLIVQHAENPLQSNHKRRQEERDLVQFYLEQRRWTSSKD